MTPCALRASARDWIEPAWPTRVADLTTGRGWTCKVQKKKTSISSPNLMYRTRSIRSLPRGRKNATVRLMSLPMRPSARAPTTARRSSGHAHTVGRVRPNVRHRARSTLRGRASDAACTGTISLACCPKRRRAYTVASGTRKVTFPTALAYHAQRRPRRFFSAVGRHVPCQLGRGTLLWRGHPLYGRHHSGPDL